VAIIPYWFIALITESAVFFRDLNYYRVFSFSAIMCRGTVPITTKTCVAALRNTALYHDIFLFVMLKDLQTFFFKYFIALIYYVHFADCD